MSRSLRWYVNEVAGGNATVGVISPAGLYTAPASVPQGGFPGTVRVAESNTSRAATAAMTIIYETQTGKPSGSRRPTPGTLEFWRADLSRRLSYLERRAGPGREQPASGSGL